MRTLSDIATTLFMALAARHTEGTPCIADAAALIAGRTHKWSTWDQVGDFLLADPWQQLGVTEIAVIEPASFASSTAIAEQVALLCRNAPLWDGQLKLPSPMHLGAQIANDHPIMEMRRKSDANRLAEKA